MGPLPFREPFAFAGFFMAHALWSIDGSDEVLTTVCAEVDEDGVPGMIRIEAGSIEESVEQGKAWLDEDDHDARARLLIYDGYINIDGEQQDALIGHLRDYGAVLGDVLVTLAYRRDEEGQVTVIREGFGVPDGLRIGPDQAARGFFEGVERHTEASSIWERSTP